MIIFMRALQMAVISLLFTIAPITAQAQLGRIEVGKPFPGERFPALKDGRPMSLSAFRGKRVLLLVFASW